MTGPAPRIQTTRADVVVVAYNSSDRLRDCVFPLAGRDDVNVIVVDNASTDNSLETVADLPVVTVPLDRNGGFAHGCNAGWRRGSAPHVLFINPDARIDPPGLDELISVLDREPGTGAVGPKIIEGDGLAWSQRRFATPSTTFSQALFLHRMFPDRPWSDEMVRDESSYTRPEKPDWVSGACILVRRSVLEELGGFDEGFFMYCEDMDLCFRIRKRGLDVAFQPQALVRHAGGASAPRSALLPVLAASRIRYASKHRGRILSAVDRVGIALDAFTHLLLARGGRRVRAGHGRALLRAIGVSRRDGRRLRTPTGDAT